MLSTAHLREHVIRPVLERLGLHSESAESLLVGTALAESRLTYLVQLGNGPARGLWQMEPATHTDIHINYLMHRPQARQKVLGFARRSAMSIEDLAGELVGNLNYACAMARYHYLRVPEALPADGDLLALANYWKSHYNTHLGAGTVEHFVHAWDDASGNV